MNKDNEEILDIELRGSSGNLTNEEYKRVASWVSRSILHFISGEHKKPCEKVLTSSATIEEKKNKILNIMGDFVNPDAKDIFDEVLSLFIKNDQELRLNNEKMLLDGDGNPILKFTDDMLYQPPPVLLPNGKLKNQAKILHPGISSSIVLVKHEQGKKDEFIEKFGEEACKSFLVNKDTPSLVQERTIENLKSLGKTVNNSLVGVLKHFVFGQENIEGKYQSPNMKFSRLEVLSKVLSKLVERELQGEEVYNIKEIRICKDRKNTWFEAQVVVPNRLALNS